MNVTAALRVTPGAGHLSRNGDTLLFVPGGDDEVVLRAFAAADDGDELRAVSSTVVEAGFDAPPFVAASWVDGLRIMAFGDLAVETDHPSMPMLSGAGSRTWVEHSLPGEVVVTIDVGADAADPCTDLRSGTIPAGGFRLHLTAGDGRDGQPSAPVEPAMPETGGSASDPTAAAGRPTAMAPQELYDEEFDDPAEAAPGPPMVDDEAEVTLPPPDGASILPDDLADARRDALVEARRCSRGHLNPPTAAMCDVCAEFLAPGVASVVTAVRPSLGRLQLDDGTEIELDGELLVGRNPSRDTDPDRLTLRRVRVDGDKVSRSHLTVRFQGWDVHVEDCASTNGTFVVPHRGGQVATLEPGRPQLVDDGAVVYFGSRSFTVHGRRREEP